jgi:hypothetical protein
VKGSRIPGANKVSGMTKVPLPQDRTAGASRKQAVIAGLTLVAIGLHLLLRFGAGNGPWPGP